MRIIECITKSVRWIPSIFVTGVVLWSYYAYVVELCILTVDSTIERVLFLTLYHPFLVFFVWSFWQTVFTETLHPKQDFYLTREEIHKVHFQI